jgi:hypothetical protein
MSWQLVPGGQSLAEHVGAEAATQPVGSATHEQKPPAFVQAVPSGQSVAEQAGAAAATQPNGTSSTHAHATPPMSVHDDPDGQLPPQIGAEDAEHSSGAGGKHAQTSPTEVQAVPTGQPLPEQAGALDVVQLTSWADASCAGPNSGLDKNNSKRPTRTQRRRAEAQLRDIRRLPLASARALPLLRALVRESI